MPSPATTLAGLGIGVSSSTRLSCWFRNSSFSRRLPPRIPPGPLRVFVVPVEAEERRGILCGGWETLFSQSLTVAGFPVLFLFFLIFLLLTMCPAPFKGKDFNCLWICLDNNAVHSFDLCRFACPQITNFRLFSSGCAWLLLLGCVFCVSIKFPEAWKKESDKVSEREVGMGGLSM